MEIIFLHCDSQNQIGKKKYVRHYSQGFLLEKYNKATLLKANRCEHFPFPALYCSFQRFL